MSALKLCRLCQFLVAGSLAPTMRTTVSSRALALLPANSCGSLWLSCHGGRGTDPSLGEPAPAPLRVALSAHSLNHPAAEAPGILQVFCAHSWRSKRFSSGSPGSISDAVGGRREMFVSPSHVFPDPIAMTYMPTHGCSATINFIRQAFGASSLRTSLAFGPPVQEHEDRYILHIFDFCPGLFSQAADASRRSIRNLRGAI
ncbi:hypothetical protein FB451DRAFT_468261 [Mycena latifolia]|nr:hypothetical protein FB451DRAFT_468261 [Mycena latifolia]